jgi:hypothetical protein
VEQRSGCGWLHSFIGKSTELEEKCRERHLVSYYLASLGLSFITCEMATTIVYPLEDGNGMNE